jgi:hypothetical protein
MGRSDMEGGWLKEQLLAAREDVKSWPEWMKNLERRSDMELAIQCQCGQMLEPKLVRKQHYILLEVEACEACIKDVYDDGVKDGIEQGKDGP